MLETSFIGKVRMNWILKGAQSLLKEGEEENLFRQRKEPQRCGLENLYDLRGTKRDLMWSESN